MFKKQILLLICLVLNGCASTQYNEIYNTNLKSKEDVTIFKEGNYQELNDTITGYFKMHGYSNLVFSDPKKKFFVFLRQGDFNEPCRIILKYTFNSGDDKIRIDLMNGSDDELVTDNQVSIDIENIANEIKNH